MFKLDRIRPAIVADALAERQIAWPAIPIVFTDTRPLAEEWTYRWLAAAARHNLDGTYTTTNRLADLPTPSAPVRAAGHRAGQSLGPHRRAPPHATGSRQTSGPPFGGNIGRAHA